MEEVEEALMSACGVEPAYGRTDHQGRLLGEWLTLDPHHPVSAIKLRRRILAFLRELPEDLTVKDLRDLLEEKI